MNDQAKTSNKQLKDILKMIVIKGQKNWSKKLDENYEPTWNLQNTYRYDPLSIFINPKTCHLPIELKHKAYWAIKEMNFGVDAIRIKKEYN
jgi:hypothetical protein